MVAILNFGKIAKHKNAYRIFCNKRPGAMHFSKGGATITDK